MTPNVRIFASPENLRQAADRLNEAGFPSQRALIAGELMGQEEQAVKSAVADGLLPGHHANISIRSLKSGRSLLAVRAPFGRGGEAIAIMENSGAVDADQMPRYYPRNPAPFSDILGIPALADFEPTTGLASSDWTFSGMLGMGTLSRNQSGKDSSFGFKTLSAAKRPWKNSFGFPMLSRKQEGANSSFGFKTLSGSNRDWNWSFGFPLLSSNPAPFSSLLGIPTLLKDR